MLRRLRGKNLHTWLPGYAVWLAEQKLQAARAALRPVSGPRHVLFALCDHHEPLWDNVDGAHGRERVRRWREGYPRLAEGFRDSDGRAPRHSFFYPGEQYRPEYLEPLAELARAGLGEVEVHLHHDGDTPATLTRSLEQALADFSQHGHISRDAAGRPRWAFIHGNWCLSNSRADGRHCGVDAELPLLFDLGCYADFTFPSAPSETQPNIVNRIYWPAGDLTRRRAYEHGEPARVGELKTDRLLLIEGPLALARRAGRLALRLEYTSIHDGDPATPSRIDTWVRQGIHVVGRPEWIFVKVYTHGAPERNAAVLLGPEGRRMHEHLTRRYNDGRAFRLHYVTAREMYNIAVAAMQGCTGDPGAYRDHAIPPPRAAG